MTTTSKEPETEPPRRWAVATLVVVALSLPLVVIGAIGALKSTSNDPRQWLPREFAETDKHLWFLERFGTDEIAVVSWPGCTLADPRVEKLAASLDGSDRFQRVLTGPRVLGQLMSGPLPLSRSEIVERLRGTLIGPDGETTCVLLEVSEQGKSNRTATVEQIVQAASDECLLPREELRLAGPTVDAAAIDQESRRLLLQLAGASALISLLIAGLRLKSWRLGLIVLLTAVYSTALTLAVLYWSGGKMNLLMTMLPPLVYVLTLSAAVHLINYYRDALRDGDAGSAPRRAVSHGWLPCVLAASTTAVGLLSLTVSRIVPIQEFGLYAALGMVVSLLVLLVGMPSALICFPATGRRRGDEESNSDDHESRFHLRYLSALTRYHWAVAIVCLVLMLFFGLGLARVDSTVKLQDRFVSKSKILSDYRWLEDHLGPLIPLEVVIRFDRKCRWDFYQRLELVNEVSNKINSLDVVGATLSAVNFAPSPPGGGGARQTMRRAVYKRRLERNRQQFIDSHLMSESDEEQLWRISVRANAMIPLDYGEFSDTLQATVDPLISSENGDEVSAIYTGVIPLIYKAQRQLLYDLVRSFVTAFLVIAVVMVFVMRNLWAGLLAMFPNVFPAVVIFGGMGWLGVLVQIGSVMTASAALGIAVDDTVHFLTWFRRGLHQSHARHKALGVALKRCTGAMIHTTLICCAGLAVFGLSSFVPILHFAWLMVALLIAAIVGDLVLLPAILAGPLGALLERRQVVPSRPQHKATCI